MKLTELRFSQFHMQTFPPPAENTSCNEVHFWEVSKQLPLLGHVFRVTQDHNIHQVGIPGNLDSSFLKGILKILVGNPCVTTQSLLTWPDIWGSEGHDEVFKSQHWTFLVGDHSDDHVVAEVLLGHLIPKKGDLRWIIETQGYSGGSKLLKVETQGKVVPSHLLPIKGAPLEVLVGRPVEGTGRVQHQLLVSNWENQMVAARSSFTVMSNSPGRAPEPSTWSALSNRSG